MKISYLAAALLLSGTALSAQETPATVKVGGFIRNFAHIDTKEMISGTAELFSYIPLEEQGENTTTYHYSALTSRLWVTADGYKYGNMTASSRIEADFYNGLTGVNGTAVLRLRQAFLNLTWANDEGNTIGSLKAGQAWHPMAADMPDILSLNAGAPFGPFSRTPLVQWDSPITSNLSLTAAAIWQMQYRTCGPDGASANYMKYHGIPEVYLALNYKTASSLFRAGYDFLSVTPYNGGNSVNSSLVYLYGQYKKGSFVAKAKTTYGQDGSHLNLTGGYAVTGGSSAADFEFTPSTSSSTWVSLSYGKKWQGVLFAGYIKNFGVGKDITGKYWFCGNSRNNVDSAWRITPNIFRNIGKFTVGGECELTGVKYGEVQKDGSVAGDLKSVVNTRLQLMLKFTF
ncbi:MAG: hypothetical protein KBS78_00945 [Bacteroidales bacterium]|nr:hypothetical protein [Candidatus Cryptobacteroides faecihippi]